MMVLVCSFKDGRFEPIPDLECMGTLGVVMSPTELRMDSGGIHLSHPGSGVSSQTSILELSLCIFIVQAINV